MTPHPSDPRYSQPNKYGVYIGGELADKVTHTTKSGGKVEIGLAFTEQGWASSLSIALNGCGSFSPVSERGLWYESRDQAVDVQIEELKARCDKTIESWHGGEKRKQQCRELLDWAATQRQTSLF